MYLPDAAENVLARIAREPRLESGTIAFVAHSLGGLVVKQMLRAAERDASQDRRRASLIERARKVAFLATPHSGSDIASIGNFLRAIFRPSEATAGLIRNDPFLRDLNRWYRSYASEHNIQSLVLQEAHRTRFFGQIVKPDSSDPGLPNVAPIPIEADHGRIAKPRDRSSEAYLHILDFLKRPNQGDHARVQVEVALTSLEDAVITGNERVLEQFRELKGQQDGDVVRASSYLADVEATRQLSTLRKSRFFNEYEHDVHARRLASNVISGELSSASASTKREALYWCARLLAQHSTEEAQRILSVPVMDRDSEEVSIARAFIVAARGDYSSAMAGLAKLATATARTASLVVVTWEQSVEGSIRWFREALNSPTELDSDGKFILIQGYLATAQWSDALSCIACVTEEDFATTPALIQTVAMVHLVQVVAPELRQVVLSQGLVNFRDFPLAADADSLQHRRRAQHLLERCSETAATLGCDSASNAMADRALWLGLRDPDRGDHSRRLLEQSMSQSAHALRRLPLALQFGLKLDLSAVEAKIDQETALSRGRSIDAAVARFAIAMAQGSEEKVADYIDKHRRQLIEYYVEEVISGIEIEMLARAGRVGDAEAKLTLLEQNGGSQYGSEKLKQLILEAKGADPVQGRVEQYGRTGEIGDLINLVSLLEERRDWEKLESFVRILFGHTRELAHAELLVQCLIEKGDDESISELIADHPVLITQSEGLLAAQCWALYRLGDVQNAAKLLAELRVKRDDPNDRALHVNIAIATGEWTSLLAFIEREWEQRGERTAAEIVGAAQLASYVGSVRMGDLLKEAVAKAPDDPNVLITCYSISTSAGLDDEEVSSWLHRAANLSDDEGPVQKASLGEIIARQPDWQRRETDTWKQLTEGQLPLFVGAQLLNRTLADMYLRTALTNVLQGDVRKRGIIFFNSGSRRPVTGAFDAIALDPSALLTLGFLGVLGKVVGAFRSIAIPHSTLGWLLDERQRSKFHQPSRIASSRELQLLLSGKAVMAFEPTTRPNEDLAAEIGDDLAAMIAEALSESEGEGQAVVVRPSPVYRAGSLMEEPADMAAYHHVLCGCSEVVEALKRFGVLTAAEERRAASYLKLNESQWPNPVRIEQGATLYLDDLAVNYLQHLGLLEKLSAAQLTAIISSSQVEEAQALLRYEAVAEKAASILDEVRVCLSEAIQTGQVILGRLSKHEGGRDQLTAHPCAGIFEVASRVDALVIDDRAFNSHANIDIGSASRPILTTLDLLATMVDRGFLDSGELQEFRAKLRGAGFSFVPLTSDELIELLRSCPVDRGILSETAEIRSIRENLLRIRMTNSLQLPFEYPWFESLLDAWVRALRAQWNPETPEDVARARSNWLIAFVDLRQWSHCYPEDGETGLWNVRYRAQVMTIMTIAHDQPQHVRSAFWRWLEDSVVGKMKRRDPESYAWVVDQSKLRIVEMIEELTSAEEASGEN